MTWSKTELAQLAREAGEQAVRAAMAGGSGSSQRAPGGLRLPSLGKKQGIPNWNCRCGAVANFGTRPSCRDCGAEAPKRILKLQVTKAAQGGATPATTPPTTPRAGSTPGTPSLRPHTPRQTGLNTPNPAAQNGAWGTINGARRVHWAETEPPQAPDGTAEDPAELRKELTGLRQTLQTAKNAGTSDDVLQLLETKIASVQTRLDATRPKDAQLQSLLDKKKGLSAKLTAVETRISKAKEELQAAEEEHATVKEGLAQVETKLEAAFREQGKDNPPAAVDAKAEDPLILKAFDDATTPEERVNLLKALEALQYTPVQAQARYHLLRPPPPPPQPEPGSPEAEAAEADAAVAKLEAATAKAKAAAAAKKAALQAAEEAKAADTKAKEAQKAAEGKPDDSPEKQAAKKAAEEAAESEAKRARTAKQAEQAAQEAGAAQAAMDVDAGAQDPPPEA